MLGTYGAGATTLVSGPSIGVGGTNSNNMISAGHESGLAYSATAGLLTVGSNLSGDRSISFDVAKGDLRPYGVTVGIEGQYAVECP